MMGASDVAAKLAVMWVGIGLWSIGLFMVAWSLSATSSLFYAGSAITFIGIIVMVYGMIRIVATENHHATDKTP